MHTRSFHRPYACSGSRPASSARRHGIITPSRDASWCRWLAYEYSPVNGTGVRLALPGARDLATYTRTPRPVSHSLILKRLAPATREPTKWDSLYSVQILDFDTVLLWYHNTSLYVQYIREHYKWQQKKRTRVVEVHLDSLATDNHVELLDALVDREGELVVVDASCDSLGEWWHEQSHEDRLPHLWSLGLQRAAGPRALWTEASSCTWSRSRAADPSCCALPVPSRTTTASRRTGGRRSSPLFARTRRLCATLPLGRLHTSWAPGRSEQRRCAPVNIEHANWTPKLHSSLTKSQLSHNCIVAVNNLILNNHLRTTRLQYCTLNKLQCTLPFS